MDKRTARVTKSGSHVLMMHTSDSAETKAFRAAVQSAIRTNQENGHPIARYDVEKRCAYLEYPDGKREYAK
jgi:hypothetical protein